MAATSTLTSFSSSGEEAIQRKLEALNVSGGTEKSEEEIRRYYEIDKCLEFVSSHKNVSFFLQSRVIVTFQVALQFPDHLLCDSSAVALLLRQESGREDIFILGDTSYGRYVVAVGIVAMATSMLSFFSCCVDEVSAEHVGSEGIIHFGPSCLTA